MARGRRGFGGHTSVVGHKEWTSADDTISAIDIAENFVGVGGTGLVATETVTLLRTRGSVGLQLDIGAVDERALIVCGIIIVNTPAFVAGAASLPSPVTEDSADWLWLGSAWLSSGAEAAVVTDLYGQRLEIDSKAMRKFGVDETIVFIVEVAESVDQTGSFDVQYYFRVLVGN